MRQTKIGEALPVGDIVGVDAITKAVMREAGKFRIARQHPGYYPQRDVAHIIRQPSSIGKTGRISG